MHNRPSCAPEGGCCSRRVLGAERDVRDQEVEALDHYVLFALSFIGGLTLSSAAGAEQKVYV